MLLVCTRVVFKSRSLIIIQFIVSVANVCLSLGGGSNFRDVNCGQRYSIPVEPAMFLVSIPDQSLNTS